MKPYPNNEKYVVFPSGAVWSSKTSRFMKTHTDNSGYHHISFYKKGKRTTRLLHRVVLETYRGPCPKGSEALHNDADKSNNGILNLKWGTKQENMEDSKKYFMAHGGTNSAMAKLTPQNVKDIRSLVKQGMSNRKVAKLFDVDHSAISRINTGKTYRWVRGRK